MPPRLCLSAIKRSDGLKSNMEKNLKLCTFVLSSKGEESDYNGNKPETIGR